MGLALPVASWQTRAAILCCQGRSEESTSTPRPTQCYPTAHKVDPTKKPVIRHVVSDPGETHTCAPCPKDVIYMAPPFKSNSNSHPFYFTVFRYLPVTGYRERLMLLFCWFYLGVCKMRRQCSVMTLPLRRTSMLDVHTSVLFGKARLGLRWKFSNVKPREITYQV